MGVSIDGSVYRRRHSSLVVNTAIQQRNQNNDRFVSLVVSDEHAFGTVKL